MANQFLSKINKSKLIIIRHGESVGNKKEIIQGNLNVYGLTTKGVLKTICSSKYIKVFNPSLIISSELKRAYETAEILKDNCDVQLPVLKCQLFNEINFGILEGITKTQRNIEFKKEYNELKSTNYDYSIFNGESSKEVNTRVLKSIDYLSKIDDCCIIIVSHGGFIREFLKKIIDENIEDMEFDNNCAYLIEKNKKIKKIY